MKFINDINLSNSGDVKGKEVQDTSDIFELSMSVILKKLFDSVTDYTPRQDILNSFGIYAATAFQNYNTYRDTLFTINPNASNATLGFPEKFPLTPFVTSDSITKTNARNNTANNRPLRGVDGVIIAVSGKRDDVIGEYGVWITPYESYIKNANNTLKYYLWDVVTRKDTGAFVEYIDKIWGTTIYT